MWWWSNICECIVCVYIFCFYLIHARSECNRLCVRYTFDDWNRRYFANGRPQTVHKVLSNLEKQQQQFSSALDKKYIWINLIVNDSSILRSTKRFTVFKHQRWSNFFMYRQPSCKNTDRISCPLISLYFDLFRKEIWISR